MRKLVSLRIGAGLSQERLAAKAGVCRSVVQKLEAGRGSIRVGTAKKLAKALGVNWTIFFDDDAQNSKRVS